MSIRSWLSCAALSVIPLLEAVAQPALPTGSWSSSPRSGVTFGGAGIVGPVMESQVGSSGIWLTLSATPRFDNAPLANDGAGTFFASPGADACTPSANASCPRPGYARWNFNYAISGATSTTDLSQFEYQMFYTITPEGAGGPIWFSFAPNVSNQPIPLQNSLNVGMPILDQNGAAAPNTSLDGSGTYRFALVAYQPGTDLEVGSVGIAVTATTTVPEPSTWLLTAVGGVALMLVRRRGVQGNDRVNCS